MTATQSTLIAHCGASKVDREFLKTLSVPEATRQERDKQRCQKIACCLSYFSLCFIGDTRTPILFKQGKSAADLPIPFHGEAAEAIAMISQIGDAALLALLLKMVLKERITDDEIPLICDVYYHDET